MYISYNASYMNLVLKKRYPHLDISHCLRTIQVFPCTDVVKRNDILIMWKVWKEIIPFRTSYFTNMTKYALVNWYNFTWNWYLLPLLLGCEESGLFFMVYWKVILKQEDFFPVTRCLSFDQLSSILQAPTPPPLHPPPCGYMMQCYFGKCPLLLS